MSARVWILTACLALLAAPAFAHKASDSYLTLRVEGRSVHGQWDIALRDLELAVGLDTNGDGAITWGELRQRHSEIARYALGRLKLATDGGACPATALEQLVDDHSDGAYTVLRFDAVCPYAIGKLELDYRLLFDIDADHRGLLRVERGGATRTAIASPDRPALVFEAGDAGALTTIIQYVREGVWHIWIGLDHVLFLLALLLPAVLAPTLRAALLDVLKVVTAFTVAHSITLTLAALGLVTLPSRVVESAIALSVVLVALNNVVPVMRESRWTAAFAFGLLHGFGFAGALADLGLPRATFAWALFSFNIGVELGQLAIVAVFLPLAWWLRGTWLYRRVVLLGGSLAVAAIAAIWLTERVFDLKIISR